MVVTLFWLFLIVSTVNCIVADEVPSETCQTDAECPLDKICVENACVNPCSYLRCQGNTKCRTKHHETTCVPGQRHKKYVIPNDGSRVDWFTAISKCNSKGMRLASVLNEEENNQLKRVAEERLRSNRKFDNGGVYWVSGLDAMMDGSWRWMTSGDLVNFTDWHPGSGDYPKEPFTSDKAGYHFMTAGYVDSEQEVRYGWYAQDKDFNTLYVCEYFI